MKKLKAYCTYCPKDIGDKERIFEYNKDTNFLVCPNCGKQLNPIEAHHAYLLLAVKDRQMNIMLVDDSNISLQQTGNILSGDGYNLIMLQSGIAAMNYIKRGC